MTHYQLVFCKGTQMQGQPVMSVIFTKLDDAKSVAQLVTRFTSIPIDVLEIKAAFTTTVVANLNG